jgi:serine/threonine protein kinase/Tol biopolymer transport system component
MGENRKSSEPALGADDPAARAATGGNGRAAADGGGVSEPPTPLAPRWPSTAPLIGNTVTHYRILERLGGGGMGVVYKGWDLRLERYAALKFLSPQRSSSDDFKRRFAREARTASRLEHSNICTVFESDETEDGRLFIAMAFCEGESLKRKIERGPLPLQQALAIAAQVAAGLAAAHEKGVVHRDVKPGNMMVAEDGRVKIVDFGIARLADETHLTRAGDVMGTTAYIAPEQFLSADIDHRADLWSLGVVTYEMVTGRLPWSGGDERELVNAILKRAPRPLSALRPGVPQALERVIARALAKRPVERYQRADELRADLLAVAELVAQPPTAGPYEQTVVEAPLPPGRERPATPTSPARAEPAEPAAAPERAAGQAPAGAESPGAEAARRPAEAPAEGGEGGDRVAAEGAAAVPGLLAERGSQAAAADADGGAAATPRPGGGMLGRVISHYRILSPLGGGGMGVVYKAQDLSLERVVALKFLPPELTRDPEAKARFLQEARAASALDHPNICTIHEVRETDEGQLYLAMACYDGETLKQRLQRGRLPIDEAVETAQQVARGLVKAHRHGIVHRDIKPANLMITTDEIVKILDFGIAKLAGAAGLTRVGSSLGTPGYMSPEQARGEEVDPRTDVWSLGAVLYEMVTGRRPFRGEHEQTVLYSLFNEEPEPVQQLRPDAPPELVRIIGRMLAKDPEQRYPTAAAALADLRALYGPATSTGTMTGATSVPMLARPALPRSRRHLAAVFSAAVLAVAGLAAYLLLRSGQAPAPSQLNFTRLTELAGKESYPSLSSDASFFVYVKSLGGRSHIYRQRVGGSKWMDLSEDSTSDDTHPAVSPDNQQIAFRSEREGGGIFVMGSTGENVRRLTNFGYNPAWSPDGLDIALATEGVADPAVRSGVSQIWRVRVATAEKQLVFAGDGVQPSWSPHGLRIAYWGRELGRAQRTIWTIPASGGRPTPATSDDNLNWDPVWSTDGKHLYFASDRSGPMNLWRLAIDEASGKVLGEPEPLTTPAPWSAFLSFSRDGRRFAYATDDGKSNLERIELDADISKVLGPPAAVTEGSRAVVTFDPSPDGKWIVFSTAAPQEDIFVIHPDRTGLRQLTNDRFKNRVPRWSPDGSLIAFYSNRGGTFQGWTIRPDGSDLRLISTTRELYNPVWSPDGKTLACSVGAHFDLCLIDLTLPLAERRPVPLPHREKPLYPSSWSLDGKRLVGTVEPGILVYSFPSHGYERVTSDAVSFPIWLHDSRRLLYLRDGKVMIADIEAGSARELLRPPGDSEFIAAFPSPDDHFLYTLHAIQEGDIWLGTFR